MGREVELGAVGAALDRARAGRGGTLFVVGDAGVGKSALVRAATAAEANLLEGRATPPPAPSYRPLVEVALGAVRLGAEPDAPGLRLHRPGLGVLLGGPDIDEARSELPTPVHLGEALLSLCQTARRPPPAVIVLEDLHWADAGTLGAVEYIADRARGSPMAIVATLRPGGPASALVERLRARASADVLTLGGLAPAGVHDLVATCLGGDPPAGLLDGLAAAEGVPLFVEEMLALLEQRGDLVAQGPGWRYRAVALSAVPAGVESSVRERVRGLSPGHRHMLEAAALLGRDFDAGHVAAGLALAPAAVDEALAEAARVGLLTADPTTGRPRFAHALVHEAVLTAGPGPALAATAARLLDTLPERPATGGPDMDLGARLALAAGDAGRAAGLYEQAGRRAARHGLPADAAGYFERAIEVLPSDRPALPLHEALLHALAAAGDATRALQVGATVRRQLAAAGVGGSRQVEATVAMAKATANAGRWEEADQLLRAVPAGARPPGAQALHGSVFMALNRFDDAAQSASLVLADPAAPPAAVCEAAEVMGRLARRSDLAEARQWFEHAVGTAELHGLSLWRARALHELATIDQLRTCAVAGLLDARDAAIVAGAPGLLAAVEFHVAALHGVRFEIAEALAAARRCLDAASRLGAERQEAWAWNLIAQAHASGGERERARAAADEALRMGGGDPEIVGVALGTGYGLAALIADDMGTALSRWREAIAALRSLPAPAPLPPWYLWALLATVYDLEGDGGTRARAETDVPELRTATGPDGLWHLAEAVAAGRRGDTEGAARAVAAADERFALCPAFAGYAHLGHRVAAEAAIADRWGEPARWLAEASAWAAPRHLTGIGRACAALARRAGVRQRRPGRGETPVPAHLARLGVTGREVDVLQLVAEGCTNKEVAERLYLSLRTVKGHVESLLAKTGSANRTQLAALAGPAA